MNGDIEQLLREGVDRLTADVQIPADLVARASTRVRRRRIATRAALACGTAAVTAAAVIAVAVAGAQPGTGGVTGTRMTAYVIKRVQHALAEANFVIQGRATGANGPTLTWAYGNRWRMEEFTPSSRAQPRYLRDRRPMAVTDSGQHLQGAGPHPSRLPAVARARHQPVAIRRRWLSWPRLSGPAGSRRGLAAEPTGPYREETR